MGGQCLRFGAGKSDSGRVIKIRKGGIFPRTDASFLMAKQPTGLDPEMFAESFSCK